MYAITGITGQVGASLAEALHAIGTPFRAIVRDAAKASRFAHAAIAELDDTPALTRAFEGAEAVFILLPPLFDPSPGFPESGRTIASIRDALLAARPDRVVVLSTIGADAPHENLLSQLAAMEQVLGELPMPVAFLRAAWFIENTQWDVSGARATGLIESYLQPLDRRIAMVATRDIGALAAKLLGERWEGVRVVELEGPVRISPDDIAASLGRALGRPVVARAVHRGEWEARFRAQGMTNPAPRMRMIDRFNEGWIDFGAGALKGDTSLDRVIAELVARG
jgi:uncharacterized protein YbjT (DUF2867 family)